MSTTVTRLRSERPIEVSGPPLIPDGEYSVAYLRHESAMTFRAPKVYIHFRVITPGEYMGAELYRAYRVEEIKRLHVRVRQSSDLFRHWCALSLVRERRDRIHLSRLRGMALRVTTRTVTTDYRQRPIPELARYSVIDQLLAVEAGRL